MLIDVHPVNGDMIAIHYSQEETWRVKGFPAISWNKEHKIWECPIIPNVSYMRANFQRKNEYTPQAIARIKSIINKESLTMGFRGQYPGEPMKHQRSALALAQDKHLFFFAHAMGTGKTFTILTLSAHLWKTAGLEGLLVVCPATIRRDVWQPEITKWLDPLGINYRLSIADGNYQAIGKAMRTHDEGTLDILVVGVESMSSDKNNAYKIAISFLEGRKCGMAIDESSRIKNYQAVRTKNIIRAGRLAKWRWCATGTKITQGIHDLYSQFEFLDWAIIGQRSFYGFKNRYCLMGGWEGKAIIGYQNTNELLGLIKPYIHVVRKEDANDLPEKTYETRTVTASKEQKELYRQLKDYMEATLEGNDLTVTTILTRMARYQQISGGNFPYNDNGEWKTKPIKNCPKIEELMGVLESTDEKVIIWCRFTDEILQIANRVAKKYGADSLVLYYGPVPQHQRTINKDRFQNDEMCRFFIANQATASLGLTLTAATLAVYYSNSFSFEDRTQSEDRCHRTGQTNPVKYIDLLSDLPIDKDIRRALAKKKSMANFVADELRAKQ